jgi:hypothetical protein
LKDDLTATFEGGAGGQAMINDRRTAVESLRQKLARWANRQEDARSMDSSQYYQLSNQRTVVSDLKAYDELLNFPHLSNFICVI